MRSIGTRTASEEGLAHLLHAAGERQRAPGQYPARPYRPESAAQPTMPALRRARAHQHQESCRPMPVAGPHLLAVDDDLGRLRATPGCAGPRGRSRRPARRTPAPRLLRRPGNEGGRPRPARAHSGAEQERSPQSTGRCREVRGRRGTARRSRWHGASGPRRGRRATPAIRTASTRLPQLRDSARPSAMGSSCDAGSPCELGAVCLEPAAETRTVADRRQRRSRSADCHRRHGLAGFTASRSTCSVPIGLPDLGVHERRGESLAPRHIE